MQDKGFIPLETTGHSYPESRSGFTLIELMVVIAIIAVLAAVVAPQVFRQVEKGRIASVISFYNSVKVAATNYYLDVRAWPPTCGVSSSCDTEPGSFIINAIPPLPGWDGPYLDRWPAPTGNPFGGYYDWRNLPLNPEFGPFAPERFITLPMPTTAAQRLDVQIDGTINAGSGIVQSPDDLWVPSGVDTVYILVSRDGPVS